MYTRLGTYDVGVHGDGGGHFGITFCLLPITNAQVISEGRQLRDTVQKQKGDAVFRLMNESGFS